MDAGGLRVLGYHRAVADLLAREEPAAWEAVATAVAADPRGEEAHAELLRTAYLLRPEAHPGVHGAAERAAKALGITREVSIYQAEGALPSNAWALPVRDAVVVVFGGGLLASVTEDELTGVLGHELSHHVLWAAEGGRYLVAERLLDALADDASAAPVFAETARRFALATEVFADRGALLACGDLHVAVAGLLRVVTGLPDADPAAYLRQAEELAAQDAGVGSAGTTHPETVRRAWALARFAASPAAGDDAAAAVLAPRLDLDALDLPDQRELEGVTRRLLSDVLADPWWRSDDVLVLARQYFPDLSVPAGPPAGGPGAPAWGAAEGPVPVPGRSAPSTLRFLAYVLLDVVTADPDLDEEQAVERALALARRTGLGPAFEEVARAELTLPAAVWKRLAGEARA